MKKLLSLLKAAMTENMNIFRMKNKKDKGKFNSLLPVILVIALFFAFWSYANIFMEKLHESHMEFFGLTLFIVFTSLFTIVEGIYKSGSLLFNCKDDDLLLSLPIKRKTVLFVRIFKFYIFEIMFNSLFLAPAMIAYVRWVNVGPTYYFVSILSLLLIPIVPIAISCLIGGITSSISSNSKYKNLVEIIVSTLFLLVVIYFTMNSDNFISEIVKNASSINDAITKIYYPAGAYITLITDFNIVTLLIYILVHLIIFILPILILNKIYFKINTKLKAVKTKKSNKNYSIKNRSQVKTIMNKEMKKFFGTPVFIINAGFGLVLFVIVCVVASFRLESIINKITEYNPDMVLDLSMNMISLGLCLLICFTSLMTSITSSSISLEGQTINLLKSLPISPRKIVFSKILSAVSIIIPVILIGDIVIFIRYGFDIINILLILIASVLLPFVAESFGILVNLKYPKMDAENDAEVVKQSMSSMISVFGGMLLIALTIFGVVKLVSDFNISYTLTIFILILFYLVIEGILALILYRKSNKYFDLL
jgi:ABC-2 type transport system permease protein